MQDWIEIYKLQYERIAQHENQRLAFSSLVIAITTAAVAFSAETELHTKILPFLFMAILLIWINFTAAIFVSKSRDWIKHHQARAAQILEDHLPEVKLTIAKIKKPDSDKDPGRRPNLQINLHIAILAIVIVYVLFSAWLELSKYVCSA